MRTLLPLILVLAACSSEDVPTSFDPEAKAKQQAANERAEDRTAVDAGFAPEAPKPIRTVSVDPPKTDRPGSMLPPADRQYRYIGRWAATPQMCTTGAWVFKTRALTTAGESRCTFKTVASVPVGYRIESSCQAEGTKSEQTLRLSFDEGDKTMTVRALTLGPATLIYCGD